MQRTQSRWNDISSKVLLFESEINRFLGLAGCVFFHSQSGRVIQQIKGKLIH
jgi:hypothetical protein